MFGLAAEPKVGAPSFCGVLPKMAASKPLERLIAVRASRTIPPKRGVNDIGADVGVSTKDAIKVKVALVSLVPQR